MISTEVRLRARAVDPAAFEFVQTDVPSPEPGHVVVRNLFMSLDPGMLRRIVAPGLGFDLGRPLTGEAIGEVVDSSAPGYEVGDLVAHPFGWREYATAATATLRRIDADAYPTLSMHLNFGLVAYTGLFDVAGFRAGDTVFVSSAAGAVGALAGQFARLGGAKRVIGSAGSPEKVRYLTERLGFDAAFDYHDRELDEDIDVYFDNVGGRQLTTAIEHLNPGGRVVLCGVLDDTGADLPSRLLLARRLSVRGFSVLDHLHRAPDFSRDFRDWLANGLVYDETVVDGLRDAPRTLLDLGTGKYRGKVVVRLGETTRGA